MNAPIAYAGRTWPSARNWCLWIMQHNAAPGPAQNEQQAALDAYRAEVLAEDGQAYDGELAMLRGLVRTLRVVVRPDGVDVAEVRRLLHHHAADDAEAREKSSPTGADATFFQPGHTYSSGRTTFRCEHLSAHPTYGERRAIGWVQQDGHFDEVRGLDPDDWALGGWTDVTEGGEAR